MKKIVRPYLMKGIIAATFSLVAFISLGQGIRSSVSRKDILIGEQITYVLQMDLPSPEYKVSINIPDSVDHFDIIKKSGGVGTDKKGNYVWQQTLVFTSFDSGAWNFPAFIYKINHLNTASQNLYTDTFRVNVGYMPIDKGGNPRDIKTVIDVNYFDWFWVWVGAAVLLLLVLLFFLYRHFKNRGKKTPEKISLGAYDEAMKELAELRKANETNALPVKEFHTKLADVLKNYYGKKNHQNYLNKTTEEILAKLKSHELKAETQQHMAEALHTGDAVKFAKYRSTYTENEAALNYLSDTIEETEKSLTKK